jgi:hypothetical protein
MQLLFGGAKTAAVPMLDIFNAGHNRSMNKVSPLKGVTLSIARLPDRKMLSSRGSSDATWNRSPVCPKKPLQTSETQQRSFMLQARCS